ncbi:uncharacterized protein LOC123703535 [Colias croceus]|uniref:uncharacterized protein LOC123703535 n=1 Tax=Colias crocea TaxID=72248 RepID=UPI001E27CF08|nr:uncharacterized protein LOC123703535 [Colias croceus]
MEKQSEDDCGEKKPLPDDFCAFLPWACNQYQLDFLVVITRDLQNEYVSVGHHDRMKKGKSKAKLTSRMDVDSEDRDGKSDVFDTSFSTTSKTLKITALYDANDNLIKLKFLKNKLIPQKIWKIIGLMIQFQTYLTNITINGGLDQYTIYEISKFLNTSHLTELILDYSFLGEANYYLLFESENPLRYISLAGCGIDNTIVQTIASRLAYPLPASKKLRILNLSSNKITDSGAKHLADTLRSNRHLTYLNIAGNRISDVGASYLFDVLSEFPLLTDEIMQSRQRHMDYLKHKNDVIAKILQDLKAGDFEKRASKRKSLRPPSTPSTKRGKLDKEGSLKSLVDPNAKSLINVDMLLYDKAINMAENAIGDFEDPFSSSNTCVRDGILYCKGNNSLSYLNIGFNNLSYVSLNRILNVLLYQKSLDRRPSGLINIVIEGNPMPASSLKINEIDDIIDKGLESFRRMSGFKKRPHSKTMK